MDSWIKFKNRNRKESIIIEYGISVVLVGFDKYKDDLKSITYIEFLALLTRLLKVIHIPDVKLTEISDYIAAIDDCDCKVSHEALNEPCKHWPDIINILVNLISLSKAVKDSPRKTVKYPPYQHHASASSPDTQYHQGSYPATSKRQTSSPEPNNKIKKETKEAKYR